MVLHSLRHLYVAVSPSGMRGVLQDAGPRLRRNPEQRSVSDRNSHRTFLFTPAVRGLSCDHPPGLSLSPFLLWACRWLLLLVLLPLMLMLFFALDGTASFPERVNLYKYLVAATFIATTRNCNRPHDLPYNTNLGHGYRFISCPFCAVASASSIGCRRLWLRPVPSKCDRVMTRQYSEGSE